MGGREATGGTHEQSAYDAEARGLLGASASPHSERWGGAAQHDRQVPPNHPGRGGRSLGKPHLLADAKRERSNSTTKGDHAPGSARKSRHAALTCASCAAEWQEGGPRASIKARARIRNEKSNP